MARVKLTKVYASPRGCFPEGKIIEVSDQEALDLCVAGAAEPVHEVEVETAIAPEPDETAVAKGGKGSKPAAGKRGSNQSTNASPTE